VRERDGEWKKPQVGGPLNYPTAAHGESTVSIHGANRKINSEPPEIPLKLVLDDHEYPGDPEPDLGDDVREDTQCNSEGTQCNSENSEYSGSPLEEEDYSTPHSEYSEYSELHPGSSELHQECIRKIVRASLPGSGTGYRKALFGLARQL